MQLRLQRLPWRQHGQILRDVDATFAKLKQFNLFLLFTGAQDDADRWRFIRLLFMLRESAQVQLHLALVLSLEGPELQFDGNKPFELAVIEQ